MRCVNCGNELLPGENSCSSCNASVISAETLAGSETAAAFDSTQLRMPSSRPPRGKRALILAVAIPITILLLASAAWAAISAGLFLSPRQYYAVVETSNCIKKSGELRSMFYGSLQKFMADSEGKPTAVDMDLQVAIDMQSVPEENADAIRFLNALKLHSSTKRNPKELKLIQTMEWMLEGNKLLDLNFYLDKTKLYANVPVLLDNYFFADLRNLRGICSKFGMDESKLPENLTEDDIRAAFDSSDRKETAKKAAALLRKYGKLYFDSLPEDGIELERFTRLELENQDIRCSKLVIRLSEQQLKDFILVFTSAMKKDEELYDLLNKNAAGSNRLLKSSSIRNLSTVETTENKEAFSRESYAEMIGNLEEEVKNNLHVPEGISMTIWAKNGTMIKRTVDSAFGGGDRLVRMAVATSGTRAADGKYRTHASVDISGKDESDGTDSAVLTFDGSRWTDRDKTDIRTGEVNITAKLVEDPEASFYLNWDTRSKAESASRSVTTKYEAKFVDRRSYDNDFSLNGELTDLSSGDTGRKTFQDHITLSAHYENGGDAPGKQFGGKLELKLKGAYDAEFRLPEFDSEKTVDLSKVDQEQLAVLGSRLGVSIMDLIGRNPSLREYFDLSALFGGTE